MPGTCIRVETSDRWAAILIHHEGAWVSFHSRDNPVAEADAVLSALPGGAPPDALVLIGMGLGYLVDALDRRAWRGRLLVLEPVPAIHAAVSQRPVIRAWQREGRLTLVAGPDYGDAADIRQALDDLGADPVILTHPVLLRTHPQQVAAARALVDRAIGAVAA